MYKILLLLSWILLSDSSSYRFSEDTYDDDDSLWTLSRNYRNEIENEAGEIKGVGKEIDIKMPDVSPQKPETYFCTARRMPDEDAYIVAYKPHAKMQTAHHMLMYGCDDVDNKDSKGHWECNEMGGTCKGLVNKIMYAWAMDAPALALPDNVGFHVGGTSRIKYIVLQVHYANVDKFKFHHETDHSGVVLRLQSQKPQYFAGIYLVAAGGPPIPPKKEVFDMNMGCEYTVGPEMHPFAFRVHTHKLGYVVTGYRVRDGEWHLIGKGDPKRPQAFYEVDSKSSLLPGDKLAARCTYNSMKRDHTTYIGATGADEMCNFYMMYWYDPAEGRSSDACLPAMFRSSDYPADTDEPLAAKTEMKMRREMDDEWEDEQSLDLTDRENLLVEQARDLTANENWPVEKLQYKGLSAGQVSGVAILATGDVVIFHRADRIWEANTFDSNDVLSPELREAPITDDPVWFLKKRTGEVWRSWGKNKFYFPHGLSTDHEDNMWFTDVGMHQVFKYSKDGEKLLELGEKFVPGSDLEHFCKPTDVAVQKDGVFFVSDGYCNSRILKFYSSGKFMSVIDHRFLLSIPGFPRPLDFDVPHGLSLDNDRGLLFVADRENGRVVAFDSHTRSYRGCYTGLDEQVFGVCFSPLHGGVLNAIVNNSPTQPFVYGSTIDLKTKKMIQQWHPEKGFTAPHDIACDSSGKIVYVAEITSPGRLWKLEEETERMN